MLCTWLNLSARAVFVLITLDEADCYPPAIARSHKGMSRTFFSLRRSRGLIRDIQPLLPWKTSGVVALGYSSLCQGSGFSPAVFSDIDSRAHGAQLPRTRHGSRGLRRVIVTLLFAGEAQEGTVLVTCRGRLLSESSAQHGKAGRLSDNACVQRRVTGPSTSSLISPACAKFGSERDVRCHCYFLADRFVLYRST